MAANWRQKVFACIKKHGTEVIVILADIAKDTGLTSKEVYAAAKVLCKKNLAVRHEVPIKRKLASGEEKTETRIGLQYIDPWSTKLSKKW